MEDVENVGKCWVVKIGNLFDLTHNFVGAGIFHIIQQNLSNILSLLHMSLIGFLRQFY